MRPVLPPAITPGSRIAVTCPASPVDPDRLNRGIGRLENLGYDLVRGRSCSVQGGLWAGEDRARAEELLAFLRDPSVSAVFAGRGGVGCMRLLPYLEDLPDDCAPTWIVGRSDLTALHLALWKRFRWIGLSGPMVATDFGGEEPPPPSVVDRTFEILNGTAQPGPFRAPALRVLHTGTAEGNLIPVNLSLLTAMIGTPYLPNLRGAILVIEEIGEPPRRVDRMLTQLRLSGVLDGIAGLILGQFTGCREEKPGFPEDLIDSVLRDHIDAIGVPALSGFPYGHETEFEPLPVGVRARIRPDPPALVWCEEGIDTSEEELT